MANTIALAQTIAWASALCSNLPLSIGINGEPAFSSANIIQNTIMNPPFSWKWNRNTLTFAVVQGTQDYQVNVSNFGFLETVDLSGVTIANQNMLAISTEQMRPNSIAPQYDNGVGTVTFRLFPMPDAAYTVTATYQQKPILFSGLAQNWLIPDEYSHIYNWGFLALAYMYFDDPRFQITNSKFVGSLLSVSEGLTETEKELFMAAWYLQTERGLGRIDREKQGTQGRGI